MRTLQSNVVSNLLQTVLGTGLLFLLYRFINQSIGVSEFGIWSVVLATVAVSHLTDLGLTAGITRFVARDIGRANPIRAGQVIDTVMITMAAMVAILSIPLYYLGTVLLPLFFKGHDLALARLILPYALVSLWFTMLSTAVQGALDGCQRMDIRAALMLSGQLLFLLLALWLIPRHGILGLAWAQLLQGMISVAAGRIILRRLVPHLRVMPLRWNPQTLKEMISYGLNIQASTALLLLFDPVTKALLARLGGPATAGLFEMANQVVLKARALIISANQAVVPYIAATPDPAQGTLNTSYARNMRSVYSTAIPMFSMVALWSPLVSWVLLGSIDPDFIKMAALLSAAWCINVFNAPAYFFNMGTGAVHWNTWCQLITSLSNVGLGYGLGSFFAEDGVITAYAASLCAGSLFLVMAFQINNRVSSPRPSWPLFRTILCPIAAGIALAFVAIRPLHTFLTILAPIGLSTLCISGLLWCDPHLQALLQEFRLHAPQKHKP